MQGCDSGDTYVYCTKVNTETETSAVIARVHKDTGATPYLSGVLAKATAVYGYCTKLAFYKEVWSSPTNSKSRYAESTPGQILL